MTNWNLMYDKIPMPNSRFIALYTDGGGSCSFKSENGKLYEYNVVSNSFDEVLLESLDNFMYWSYLPDDFKFWGE